MYQEVDESKNKRAGLIAAVIFLICWFLFFFMVSLRVPDPPKKPEPPLELEVNLSGGSSGGSSPTSSEQTVEEEVVEEQVEATPSDAIETQPDESTPIQSSDEDTDQETDQTEERRPDPNALFPGMPGDDGDGGDGEGDGETDGNSSGDGDGNGDGPGSGDFSLSGRSLKQKPSSNIEVPDGGIVVLDIWVAPDGSIERAEYNRAKSNLTGQRVIDYCIQQAEKELKFDAKLGAPIEQKGTYTFRFELR